MGVSCRLLLLLFALLAGCRSERVAFHFQPVVTEHAAFSESRLRGSCTPQSLNGDRLTGGVKRRNKAIFGVHLRKTTRLALLPIYRSAGALTLVHQNRSYVVAATKAKLTPAAAFSWEGLLFPGGLALCVAAFIIGINLGGFLGLVAGTVLFYTGALAGALGFAGPDKPEPNKPKSERGLRPYLRLLVGSLAIVLLLGGGLGLLLHGGTSYLAATLTGAALMLSYYIYNRLKPRSAANSN